MTLESYKKRMAELGIERERLETGLPPEDLGSVRETKVSNYLPGGEKRPLTIEPPPPGEDLSAMNPHWYKAAQKHGRKAGRKARTK